MPRKLMISHFTNHEKTKQNNLTYLCTYIPTYIQLVKQSSFARSTTKKTLRPLLILPPWAWSAGHSENRKQKQYLILPPWAWPAGHSENRNRNSISYYLRGLSRLATRKIEIEMVSHTSFTGSADWPLEIENEREMNGNERKMKKMKGNERKMKGK